VIQISNKKRKDAKLCGEVSMFESVKPKDQPNGMKYFASMLLSITVHAAILGVIVTVPLIFCNTLNPANFIFTMLAPPPLPEEISPPAPIPLGDPNGTGSGGGGGTPVVAQILTEPLSVPDVIELEAPADTPVISLRPGFGGGPDNGNGIGFGSKNGVVGLPPAITGLFKQPQTQEEPKPPIPEGLPVEVPITSELLASKLIRQVPPIYPPLAVKAGVEGTVVLLADIDVDGNVANYKVLSGHLLLRNAAIEAVRQWKYSPTILTGEPVPVRATITVVFALKK
jgi:protein TonB